MNFYWIGPLCPYNQLKFWPACSASAIKWQKFLVTSLKKKIVQFEWLYFRPDPYWPKGRLLPYKEKKIKENFFTISEIPYINLLGIRNISLKYSLKKIFKNKTKKIFNKTTIIISYNSSRYINKIITELKNDYKITYINIVSDYKTFTGADGYVFLSYSSFKAHYQNNKLHLDGAVYPAITRSRLSKIKKKKKITIFYYGGNLSKYSGVGVLLDAIASIKEKNFEVWFTGLDQSKIFNRKLLKDERIKFLGFLSETKLSQVYNNVDVFLNPRPVDMYHSDKNFPNKLFDYLAWNKPIISTFTKGLRSDFREILIITKFDHYSFAQNMIKFIPKKKMFLKYNHRKKFKLNNWDRQSERLLSFVKKIAK